MTAREQPFTMAAIRGRVTERLEGDAAREVIDRISDKHTGGPYPVRSDRLVFLLEARARMGADARMTPQVACAR